MNNYKNYKFSPDFDKLVLEVNAKVDYLLKEVSAASVDFEETKCPQAEKILRRACGDLTDFENIQEKLFELSDLLRDINYDREEEI